jgi:hypothetical protein
MTAAPVSAVPTTRLSPAELGYLLHLAPGTHALARERLHLPAEPDRDTLRAGRSALAARGGVTVDRGTVRPAPENAAAAAILAAATRWVEIGVSSGGRADVLHLVEGAGVVVIVNRRAMDVLEFVGLRPGVLIGPGVMRVLTPLVAAPSLGLVVVNAVGFDESPGAVIGVRTGDEWRLARRDDSLPAGAVAAVSRTTEPGPGWSAVGTGGAADLLSWVALAVGAGAAWAGPAR